MPNRHVYFKCYFHSSTTKLLAQVLDRKFIEHDLYILFDRLMASAKKWYEFNDEVPKRPPSWKKKEHDLVDPLDLGEQKTAPVCINSNVSSLCDKCVSNSRIL
jgi:hypothetical protein